MNKNYYAVLDLETGSLNIDNAIILSIAIAILDPTNMSTIDTFYSLVNPDQEWNLVEEKALSINKLDKTELNKAPSAKIVFKDIEHFINKYIIGTHPFNRPIMCGYNSKNYDEPIINRYCKKYNIWDNNNNKNKLFHPFLFIDVASLVYGWFHNENHPSRYSLSNIAQHLGVDNDIIANAHNSMIDVKMTAKILKRFLMFQRNIMKKYKNKIKGCFANEIL